MATDRWHLHADGHELLCQWLSQAARYVGGCRPDADQPYLADHYVARYPGINILLPANLFIEGANPKTTVTDLSNG